MLLPGGESAPAAIEDALVDLRARENALRLEFLSLLHAYGETDGAAQDGATCLAHWVSLRFGDSRSTAADLVRVAEALDALPSVASVFAEGRLSWDSLVMLTKFATPDQDELLAREAPGWTYHEIAQRARLHERRTKEQADKEHQRRYVRYRWEPDTGALRLSGRLSDTDGATFVKALEKISDGYGPDANAVWAPAEQRDADALVELASTVIADEAAASRATVVLVARTEGGSNPMLENTVPVAGETLDRVLCDARVQPVAESNGVPVSIGSIARTVPGWLWRQILRFHPTCIWPGCERRRWLRGHHTKPHSEGGETSFDNIVPICEPHHRLVHEGSYRVEGSLRTGLRFIRPDGTPIRARPDPSL